MGIGKGIRYRGKWVIWRGKRERGTEKERKEEGGKGEAEAGSLGEGLTLRKKEKERRLQIACPLGKGGEMGVGGACLLNGQGIHVTEQGNRIITPGTTYYYADYWGCITMDWIVSTKKGYLSLTLFSL